MGEKRFCGEKVPACVDPEFNEVYLLPI